MAQTMIRVKHVAVAAFAILSVCCIGRRGERCILPPTVELRAGDVVFRQGGGITSHAVMFADRGGTYSHLGIVVDSAGTKMIVHAVPDEHDFPGDSDRVKMERPEKFFSSMNAGAGLVMRTADSAAASRAARAAVAVYRRGTGFDHDYDDADTVRMYCCELVEHVYSAAGRPLTGGVRHKVEMPGFRYDSVMYPSDFVRSPRLRVIAEF